ncbi:hypothetical protein ANO11243_012050 [Dothideomycetidae sp. 11243]|nr:hypothetical protein ANO11243_012050 [fungal sp. No.11243]
MIQASQSNSLFHAYGLVKMLLWVPTEARQSILPWNLQLRSSFNAVNDIMVDIDEVAGVPQEIDLDANPWAPKFRPRQYLLDDLAMLNAADNMEKAGLHMPDHRMSDKFKAAQKSRQDIEARSNALHLPVLRNTSSDRESFDDSLAALETEAASLATKSTSLKKMKAEPIVPTYKPLFDKGVFEPLKFDVANRFAAYMDHSLRLIKAEIAFSRLSSSMQEEERETVRQRIQKIHTNIKQSMIQKGTAEFNLWEKRATLVLDELLASQADPPVLSVDRRSLEPMEAKVEEFWPAIPCMLLDIDPREKNFSSDITSTVKALTLLRDLIPPLMWRRAASVSDSIDFIATEGGSDLVAEAPAITDPSVGGRLDHREMKSSSLNRTMLEQLVEAWIEWPFRPTDAELREANSGLENVADTVEEEEDGKTDVDDTAF